MSMPSISSTKSGFPSAAATMRSVISPGRPPPSRFPINTSLSAAVSASSDVVVALGLPPPQPGRTSSSSGRAAHSNTIGAPRDQSAMCSMRSSSAGSAHCTSSNTSTSGPLSAVCSKNRRTAQKPSSRATGSAVASMRPARREVMASASEAPASADERPSTTSVPVATSGTPTIDRTISPTGQ